MRFRPFVIAIGLAASLPLSGLSVQGPASSDPSPEVGPPRGTVFAVGGGVSPDVMAKFVEAAGGPEALIVEVPTAGMDAQFSQTVGSAVGGFWKAAGAKNVVVLHTRDRAIADSESFVEPIRRAGGVWFGGGLTEQITQSYKGTRTEREIRNVLERGGVVGGTSAGAVVLGDVFTDGMQQDFSNLTLSDGFSILRGVAVDVHTRAPAPERFMSKRPDLLRIAADEPTAWVIRGDSAEIVGTGRAYVYRDDPNMPGRAFITLQPGDRYHLATHEIRRASEGSPITEQFVDSLFVDFTKLGAAAATVLVAHDGKILVDKSYNIPEQPRNIPATTLMNFTLGGLVDSFNGIAVQVLAAEGKLSLDEPMDTGNRVTIRQYFMRQLEYTNGAVALAQLIDKRVGIPVGPMGGYGGARTQHEAFLRRVLGGIGSLIDPNRTVGDPTTGEFVSNVDHLYNWELRLRNPGVFAPDASVDVTLGWQQETYRGQARLSLFGTKDGKRHAFVRIPEKRIAVIILTNKDDANTQAIAEGIVDRLLGTP